MIAVVLPPAGSAAIDVGELGGDTADLSRLEELKQLEKRILNYFQTGEEEPVV
jgi:hypothetical protein